MKSIAYVVRSVRPRRRPRKRPLQSLFPLRRGGYTFVVQFSLTPFQRILLLLLLLLLLLWLLSPILLLLLLRSAYGSIVLSWLSPCPR
jgi:hypothetical protein